MAMPNSPVYGIGNSAGVKTRVTSNGESKICNIYGAWKNALRRALHNEIIVSEEVSDFKSFKSHIMRQGFDDSSHAIRNIYFSCIKPAEAEGRQLLLKDFLVLERKHVQHFVDRNKRELPIWVSAQKSMINPYVAAVVKFNPVHYERHGKGERVVQVGTNPLELHCWALDRKIESFQEILKAYPNEHPTNYAHYGIKSIIETLTAYSTFKREYIPHT